MTAAKLIACDALDGENADGGLSEIAAIDNDNEGLMAIAKAIIERSEALGA